MQIELTKAELKLLVYGLGGGINDDGIDNLGLNARDKAKLGAIANRLHRLLDGSEPYYENVSDYR